MTTVYGIQYNPDFNSTEESSRLALQRLNVARDVKRNAFTAQRQSPGNSQQPQGGFDPLRLECQRLVDQHNSHVEQPKPSREDFARSLAVRAGIKPEDRAEGVLVKTDQFGNYHLYYGGVSQQDGEASRPDGLGHGHAVVYRNGKVAYNRPPFTDNSPEYYTDDASKEAYERSIGNSGGWGKAHHGYDINDRAITFSLGWGSKKGQYLTVRGHVDKSAFFKEKKYIHHWSRFRSPHYDLLADQIRREQ